MKKIILAAVSSTVFCIGNVADAETISSPVPFVAEHVVRGDAPSPLVAWTDSPAETGIVEDGATIGTLKIKLTGGVTSTGSRHLLIASECGTGGRDVLEFMNVTDMSLSNERRPELGTLRARLNKPAGWSDAVDIADVSMGSGVVWIKEGAYIEETVAVDVAADGRQTSFPGVYKATLCVQQVIN